MPGQSEKRYTHDGFWFFRFLRTRVTKPCSILLSLVFLLASATLVYAELEVDHRSSQPFETNLYALNGNCDLASAPAESREFRSGREVEGKIYTPKLELRSACHHFNLATLLYMPRPYVFTSIPLHSAVPPCVAPFSPRPPPLFPVQA